MKIDSYQSVESEQHTPGGSEWLIISIEGVVAGMVELLCGICLCVLLNKTPAGILLP